MRARSGLSLVLLAGFALGPARPALAGGEGARPVAAPPKENPAYVPSDAKDLTTALETLEKAVTRRDWIGVARSAQTLAEGPAEWVTYAGSKDSVDEGAFLVAQRRIVALGAPALAAYESEFGPRAQAALDTSAAAGDLGRVAEVATRWLPSAAGRAALLLLADAAIERGDADDALGRLERLEDLEDVAAPDLSGEVGKWRAARREREAVLWASGPEALPRVRTWLEAGPKAPAPAPEDVRPVPTVRDWPTTGGDASRTALAPTLGPDLSFGWIEEVFDLPPGWDSPEARKEGTDARGARGHEVKRPSLWLPPRAVVVGDRAYVWTGQALRVHQIETGLLAADPVSIGTATEPESGPNARRHWGLLEGFALTVVDDVAYLSVPAQRRHTVEGESRDSGLDEIVAVDFKGPSGRGRVLWRASGEGKRRDLPERISLHGAPLWYRGSLWVAGTRVTQATEDRYEAWLFALDPATGTATRSVFLGAGGPIRRKRGRDEIVASSCAGARGRVVVVTSLGIAAAVDASSGRTEWAYRHDRGRAGGEDPDKRLEDEAEPDERSTTFANEPPVLCGDRCYLAPTDGRWIIAIADRPRGKARSFRLWQMDRTQDFANLAVEQVVGATDGLDGGPAVVVCVGQGFHAPGELETCVVAINAVNSGAPTIRWNRALPADALQEPYGRAVMTRGEVYVSTSRGIARYRLDDGKDLPFLGASALPAVAASALGPAELPYGNLVVVPGRGILAVGEAHVAWWPARKKGASPPGK